MHEFCYAGSEKYNYYRHSDHLGSANWITDQDGYAVQYLHYLPYGELLLNQQVAGYDERYKFTDKERDAESGYDYFGARYYASPLYNWTSVDPLADQSPQISPYAYCNWNPIKFVDPDGEEKHIFLHPSNDENIYESSMNYVDNVPSIHIWAHGNNHRINFYDKNNNTTYEATTVDKLVAFLNDNVFQYSDAWKNHESEGSQAVIVLHSCETGKGKNSIGQQLSEQLPNTVVIAPNEKVAVTKDAKELGAYKTKELVKPDGTKAQTIDKVGAWVMFREGKMIGSFNGATPPNVTNPKQFQLDN
jgi:RHS repeat-associated protein